MAMNWGGGGAGVLGGAGTGASIGAIGGPVGAGIGAGVGGLLGGAAGLFSGNKDKFRNVSTLTPEQQQGLSGVFGQLGMMGGPGGSYGLAQQYNQRMLSGSPEAYQQWAAPYQTQFEQQTIPRLAEQFAGLGGGLGGGALGSSGFGQALGGAGAQFQSNLAGLYAQLQQQAAQQAFGQYNTLAGLGLGTQAFQPNYQPGNLGFGGQAAAGLLQGVGQGAGMGIGGGLSQRISNMFQAKNGQATGTDSLNDAFGANAGNGTYNPYTGYQG